MKNLRVLFRNGVTIAFPAGKIEVDEVFVYASLNGYPGPGFTHCWLRNQIESFTVGRTTYATH